MFRDKNINSNLLVRRRNYQKEQSKEMQPWLVFKVYFGLLQLFGVTDILIKFFLCSYLHSTP